jgi:hypothetical protein
VPLELDALRRHLQLERELVASTLDAATELGDGLAVGASETAVDESSIRPSSTVPTATSVIPIGWASRSSTMPGPAGRRKPRSKWIGEPSSSDQERCAYNRNGSPTNSNVTSSA